MFLIDCVADFNKTLNSKVRAFTRVVNGKVIPVRGHARKYVLATKQALGNLRDVGNIGRKEYAYLVNKHGMVSKLVEGKKGSVHPLDAIPHIKEVSDKVRVNLDDDRLYGRYMDLIQKTEKSPFAVLHNHPGSASLSAGDFVDTSVKKQIYAINENGSIFRGYAKKGYNELGHTIAKEHIAKIIANKHSKITIPELMFMTSHVSNKRLANGGSIFYRSKLSNTDKKILKKYKKTFDSLLSSKYLVEPDTIKKSAQAKIDAIYDMYS